MVALHNGRLTDRDLFPGVLWTDEERHRQRDYFISTLPLDMPSHHRQFAASKLMADYQRSQPSLRERQAIRNRIFPARHRLTAHLDDEEIRYLAERLAGANDEIGQRIAARMISALSKHDAAGKQER